MKKPVKIGLWLLGLAVLGLLGLWLEHERAKAQLVAYHRQLLAKGERLALAGHVPPPPPVASNGVFAFRKAVDLLPRPDDSKANLHRPWPMTGIAPGKAMVNWKQAQLPREDLSQPRGSTNRVTADLWPEFSAHLNVNRQQLSELAAALDLPAFNFPFDAAKFLTGSETEWFMATTKGEDWLISAALHDLRFDAVPEAWRWWRASSRLALRPPNPRAVIGVMIHNRLVARSVNMTWEALQFPDWSDAQLAEIQQLWLKHDALQAVVDGFSMERAYAIESFERNRTNWPALWASAQLYRGGFAAALSGPPDEWTKALRDAPLETLQATAPLIPWPFWTSYTEERAALKLQTGVVNAWRTAKSADSFQRGLAEAKALAPLRSATNYWQLFSDDAFEVWSADKMVRHATVVVQARLALTAIALHRHRLKHGSFPKELSALVPTFLPSVPRDFMDGNPLRYRLEPDNQFRLWSVAEDFKDGDGDANPLAPLTADESYYWTKGRDWVWPRPASDAEVKAYYESLQPTK